MPKQPKPKRPGAANGANGNAKRGATNGGQSNRRPAVARASASRRAPRRGGGSSGIVNTQSGQLQTMIGYDYVANVTAPYILSETSSKLLDIPMSPMSLSGTRWAQLASMFEKYRFVSAQMCYVPAVASIVGGQVISYWELDPTDSFGASGSLNTDLRVAMAHQNAKLHNVYDNVMINMPMRTGISDFFVERANTTDNVRWSRQATFRMIASAGLTGFLPSSQTEMVIGSVYMKWTCLFKNPQIQPSLTVPIPSPTAYQKPAPNDIIANIHSASSDSNVSRADGTVVWYDQLGVLRSHPSYTRQTTPATAGALQFTHIIGTSYPSYLTISTQAAFDTAFSAMSIVLRGPTEGATFPLNYTERSIWLGTKTNQTVASPGVYEFVLTRYDNGAMGLSTLAGGNNQVVTNFIDQESNAYDIPKIVMEVVGTVKYLYTFYLENSVAINAGFTMLRDWAIMAAAFAALEAKRDHAYERRVRLADAIVNHRLCPNPNGYGFHPDNKIPNASDINLLAEVMEDHYNLHEPDTPEQ